MKANVVNLPNSTPIFNNHLSTEEFSDSSSNNLIELLCQEMQAQVKAAPRCVEALANRIAIEPRCVEALANRIAIEVERICDKSSRIQTSGQIKSWQITLGRHRMQKCLRYYQLGSKQGRVELHSNLGAMVYRHVTISGSELGFEARYSLIEDFLQAFYIEAIKALLKIFYKHFISKLSKLSARFFTSILYRSYQSFPQRKRTT